ncbi:abortive infection family protein [Microbacterium paludicola]|uniref:abortive infection family protein n=1 Tax=Microbacterium paludicola TaxID=300019 RepID=UPI0016429854|nr:abortive infection family protein [Microbacterium paludicola]
MRKYEDMNSSSLNDEIAGALGRFFFSGAGPSHGALTQAFTSAGVGQHDPYDSTLGTPNKQQRVLEVSRRAQRDTFASKKLLENLLNALRLDGAFRDASQSDNVQNLRAALLHTGWNLSEDGRLERAGFVDLDTGGRQALDEQLERLRRNMDDPAALLGIAKELLEAVGKFILDDGGMTLPKNAPFDMIITLAFDRLSFVTGRVDETIPGARQVRDIHSSAKKIAQQVNELRNLQGTGHGRTLPTGISPETARFVIREVTHVAELMLSTHDRQMGRAE